MPSSGAQGEGEREGTPTPPSPLFLLTKGVEGVRCECGRCCLRKLRCRPSLPTPPTPSAATARLGTFGPACARLAAARGREPTTWATPASRTRPSTRWSARPLSFPPQRSDVSLQNHPQRDGSFYIFFSSTLAARGCVCVCFFCVADHQALRGARVAQVWAPARHRWHPRDHEQRHGPLGQGEWGNKGGA